MIAFLLTLLMAQGIPALPGQSGTVSGVVRTSAGTPAAGVRVSAMVPPEAGTEAALAGSFAALAQTDEQGQYRLEGIPQGRYYIVAGRVDLPTFYPGTADVSKARIFAITPGGAVNGIDFVMMDTSIRNGSQSDDLLTYLTQLAQLRGAATTLSISTQVRLEPGVKLPVFAADAFTMVRFTDTATGIQRTQTIKNSFAFNLSIANNTPEYRVEVVNLPDGYVVKSITYGTTDVTINPLKIPPALLPRQMIVTANGITTLTTVSAPPTGQTAPELTIILATVPVSSVPGVRVSGRAKDTDARSIYISGNPGTFYSDGTFEFRGVAPGRYSIAAPGSSPTPSLGASIVVGDRDIDGVEVENIAVLPNDAKQPRPPDATGTHAPGTVLPLASFRGRIIEEASSAPIEEGTIRLMGRDSITVPVGVGGEFEFPRLLPGTYDLEVRIFGHSNVLQPVVIGDEDVRVDVKTLRLY